MTWRADSVTDPVRMTKPLQLATLADTAILRAPPAWQGARFGPEYDRSEQLHRKASFWQDGAVSCVEHRVRIYSGPDGAIGPHRPGTVSA